MLSIHQMLNTVNNQENVDEGFVGDLGYSLGKRMPLIKRIVEPQSKQILPSRNPTVRKAVAVINNRSL
jgi:hypothetical protein